ncbi:MAG: 50S ribosome-binding GTPase [Rhodomicrobium sp.]|nr:50S ribosome-binding GTPase [Rhodomicrobium sp.]
MSKRTDSRFALRLWVAAICLILPTLTLVPLGGIWLWQKGYAIYWVIGACLFVVAAFLFQLYLFRRLDIPLKGPRPAELPEDRAASTWTPREQEAWNKVLAVADNVDLSHFESWQAFLGLGQTTIEAAAKSLHPEVKEPLWQFTVPEALTLVEQISLRLKPVVAGSIPFGDRLTVGQVMRIYQWSSVIGIAQKGYDIWRIIRMLNPATAATQELRERLSNQMYQWGREELAKRLARGYVKEVGRAAIDLYGGRLRISAEELEAHVTEATERDLRASAKVQAEPLRLLVCGQVNAGKSALINALINQVRAASDVLPLTDRFTAYELKREGVPQALILDSPGLTSLDEPLEILAGEAAQADLILWVASAVRPGRELDSRALDAIRGYFAGHPNRRRPPMFLVLSHVDRLRPMQEWKPPYDLADTARAKSVSIRAAMEAAGADLGFAQDAIIPACLDPDIGVYNADAIWAEIMDQIPEAQRAQLVRTLQDIDRGIDWRKLRAQALNAGRILAQAVFPGQRHPS